MDHRGRVVLVLALVAGALALATPAASADIPAGSFGFDGSVTTIARAGGYTYVGGYFAQQKQLTGGGLIVDAGGDGAPVQGAFPRVVGEVSAAVPDGSGGWFVGGDFRRVGDTAVRNLAHIRADGTVDGDWTPRTDAPVLDLAIDGSDVLIAGSFEEIDGVARDRLATVAAAGGELTDWQAEAIGGTFHTMTVVGEHIVLEGSINQIGNDAVDELAVLDLATGDLVLAPQSDGSVWTFASDGERFYVGGTFSEVDGTPRARLAAFELDTGDLADWDPAVVGSEVASLTIDPAGIYVGGSFSEIGGAARSGAALLDPATAAARGWNPAVDGGVRSIVLSGDRAYLAGYFSAVGGVAREAAAAVDRTTGALTAWDAGLNPAEYPDLDQLIVAGDTVYLGGLFGTVGGQDRAYAAAVDAGTGAVRPWNPSPGWYLHVFAVAGGKAFLGGDFAVAGPPLASVRGLARLDAAGNLDTDWQPMPAGGGVTDLAVVGRALLVSGNFEQIGGQPRKAIAKLDLDTGTATSWDAQIGSGDGVDAMDVAGSTVYITGLWHSVAGALRQGAAGVNVDTGQPTGWMPPTSSGWYWVRDIEATPQAVYLAGASGTADDLVATDPASGALLWQTEPQGSIWAVETAGETLFAGGPFDTLGGVNVAGVAALPRATGVPTAWRPATQTTTTALAAVGQTLYAAQPWSFANGATSSQLVGFDAATGAATGWRHELDGGGIPNALVADGSTLYVGGELIGIDGRLTGPFAQLPIPPAPDDRRGGGEGPGGGDRPGGGDQPGSGDRPGGGDQPGGADRPGGGAPGGDQQTTGGGGASPATQTRPAPRSIGPTKRDDRGRAASRATIATATATATRGRFALPIRCVGRASCAGKAIATALVRTRGKRRRVVIARATLRAGAGRTTRVAFALTQQGRALLTRGTTIRTTVTITTAGRAIGSRQLTLKAG